MKTLQQAMPKEFMESTYDKTGSRKFVEVEVVEEHGSGTTSDEKWPGGHKHVHYWVKLANGKAIGWNESPSHGWSFPVINLEKKVKAEVVEVVESTVQAEDEVAVTA